MQENKLATESVGKLLLSLSVPAIAAQLINVLYNLVDRMYIGRIEGIGSIALGALGVTFPLIMIISAFAALIGMGGAPRAAIKMGEDNYDDAEKILGNSFISLIILSVALMVFFYFTKEPLLMKFGATENILPIANEYFSIYLLGTLFVQIPLGLNQFISAQGFAKTSMLTVLIGAIINIILDPILIFGFNMGVKGAAIATITSQFISAVWVMIFLFSKKSTLRLRPKYFRLQKEIIFPVLALGIAPFIMQATESMVQVTLNSGMKNYGGAMADQYVSIISIIVSCMQFMTMPLMGLGQGAQPIISYNYGAKNMDRVEQAWKLLLKCAMAMSVICWLICMVFPQALISMFTNDPELINLGKFGLRIFCLGLFSLGAQFGCQQVIMALGQAKTSLILALLRKVILLIPLAIVLPMFFGTTGIYVAEPIADIIAATITVIVFYRTQKKLLKK